MPTCIYCLQDSSDSRRKAHIVPEALIQNDVILPAGAECDKCNEYAAKLEKAFIHHNRIWPTLIIAGVPGKRGKRRHRLGHFTRTRPDVVEAQIPPQCFAIEFSQTGVHLRINLPDPPEFDDKLFRRGLYHIAFSYVAWKRGVEYALRPEFDRVRQYVRRARFGEAWPYAQVMYEDSVPRTELRITLLEDAPGVTVRLRTFADDFFMDVAGSGRLHEWAARNLGDEVGLL